MNDQTSKKSKINGRKSRKYLGVTLTFEVLIDVMGHLVSTKYKKAKGAKTNGNGAS